MHLQNTPISPNADDALPARACREACAATMAHVNRVFFILVLVTTIGSVACTGPGGGVGRPSEDATVADVTPAVDVLDTTTPGETTDNRDVAATDAALPDAVSGARLGRPCTNNAQCGPAAGGFCIAGWCNELCRNEAGNRIAGRCADVAADSLYPGSWGCPSDIDACVPGAIDDQPALCVGKDDCAAGYVCGLLVGASSEFGACLPPRGSGTTGDACEGPADCDSGLCQDLAIWEPTSRMACGVRCSSAAECGSSETCIAIAFDQRVPFGFCVKNQGTGRPCTGGCPPDEVCAARLVLEHGAFEVGMICTTGVEDGGVFGSSCDEYADCKSSFCHARTGYYDGFCTEDCKTDNDCRGDERCARLPGDALGFCALGGAGHICLLEVEDYCDEGPCRPAPEFGDGVGRCGECIANCDGRECGGDGCGGRCGACSLGYACGSDGQCAPSSGCQENGDSCSNDGDCCSNDCVGGTCRSAAACVLDGALCTFDTDCCTGDCFAGRCGGASCQGNGQSCNFNNDCCSGDCSGGTCKDGGSSCSPNGASCVFSSQCCSGGCNSGGTCGNTGCRTSGESCGSSSQCCSGVCLGTCV